MDVTQASMREHIRCVTASAVWAPSSRCEHSGGPLLNRLSIITTHSDETQTLMLRHSRSTS